MIKHDVIAHVTNKVVIMFRMLPKYTNEYFGPRRPSWLSIAEIINLLMHMLHKVVDEITNVTRAV